MLSRSHGWDWADSYIFSGRFCKPSVEVVKSWTTLEAHIEMSSCRYAERCPERLFPGTFDYVASSHQIFHVFILLAACAHACAIAEAFRFWHFENGGVCDGAIYR